MKITTKELNYILGIKNSLRNYCFHAELTIIERGYELSIKPYKLIYALTLPFYAIAEFFHCLIYEGLKFYNLSSYSSRCQSFYGHKDDCVFKTSQASRMEEVYIRHLE